MMNPAGLYYAYLRKSREDREAELKGAGETLARHETALNDLAAHLGITIAKTFREVVSGETIAARPEMMKLLDEVEAFRPEGILVTEIARLARGDTRDQGLLMETFKYCHTLIITPSKIYDPTDEYDEEYAEFGLFMSRREYQSIRRRLAAGKTASAKEGKFAGSLPPYGYAKYKLPGEKGYSLSILPQQAETVRFIFEMYVNGTEETGFLPAGPSSIARVLNTLQIPPPRSEKWSPSVIRSILDNCVYAGFIRWGRRKTVKILKNGEVTRSHPLQKDCLTAPGLHQPIICRVIWDRACLAARNRTRRPAFLDTGLKNPLAGLLCCSQCGKAMVLRPAGTGGTNSFYLCRTPGCPTCGSNAALVEECLQKALAEWYQDLTLPLPALPEIQEDRSFALQKALESRKSALASLKKQLDSACMLLETGVYSADLFKERSALLAGQIKKEEDQMKSLEKMAQKQGIFENNPVPAIKEASFPFSEYGRLTAEDQNLLLKELVEKVEYCKTKRGTKKKEESFVLKIFPRI